MKNSYCNSSKSGGAIAIVAALIVLFSAMWDPKVSVTVSIAALVAFSVWEFNRK